MALALVDFWQYTSRITHGRELLGRALSGYGPQDAVRAEALFQVGLLAFWQGDDQVARGLHQQSLDLSRRLGNPTGIALALTGLRQLGLPRRSAVATARQRACSAGIRTGSASRRPPQGSTQVPLAPNTSIPSA
jgi:hypothetical protein